MKTTNPHELADILRAEGLRVVVDRGRRRFGPVSGEPLEVVTNYDTDPQRVMEAAVRMSPAPCAVVLSDNRVFLLNGSPVSRVVVQVADETMTQAQFVAVRAIRLALAPDTEPEPEPEPQPVKKTRKKKAAAPVEPVEEQILEPGDAAPVADPEPQPEDTAKE